MLRVMLLLLFALLSPAFAALPFNNALNLTAGTVGNTPRNLKQNHSVTGFYPIWENTGFIQKHRELFAGTNHLQFGIKNGAQIGLLPVQYMYRTPNLYGKFALYEKGPWHLATQIGLLDLLPGASKAYFSPMFTSRLDNPDFSLFLIPVSLSATLEVADWLDLHQTLTSLSTFTSGPLDNETNFGLSLVAEIKGLSQHSLLFHWANVGLWRPDLTILGTSYRFQGEIVEFRLGYFYRFQKSGLQSSPMVSLGFKL